MDYQGCMETINLLERSHKKLFELQCKEARKAIKLLNVLPYSIDWCGDYTDYAADNPRAYSISFIWHFTDGQSKLNIGYIREEDEEMYVDFSSEIKVYSKVLGETCRLADLQNKR